MNTLVLALAFTAGHAATEEHALDLELEVEGARRLFPLMPGTKCPAGHTCKPRHHQALTTPSRHNAVAPLFAHIKDNMKGPVTAMQEQELNNDLNTVVSSGDYCTRRGHGRGHVARGRLHAGLRRGERQGGHGHRD